MDVICSVWMRYRKGFEAKYVTIATFYLLVWRVSNCFEQLASKHRTPASKMKSHATMSRSSRYARQFKRSSSANQTQPPRNLSLAGAARMYIRRHKSPDRLRCFLCRGRELCDSQVRYLRFFPPWISRQLGSIDRIFVKIEQNSEVRCRRKIDSAKTANRKYRYRF